MRANGRFLAMALAVWVGLGAAGGHGQAPDGAFGGDDLPPFEQADVDGDGYLDLEEARRAGIPPAEFRAEDFDHDGRIDIVQYRYGLEKDVTGNDPGRPGDRAPGR